MAIGVHFPPSTAGHLARLWRRKSLQIMLGIGAALALLAPEQVLEQTVVLRWIVMQMLVIVPSLTGYGLGSSVPQVAWLVLAYWWLVSPWLAVELYRVSSEVDEGKWRRLRMSSFRFWLGAAVTAAASVLIGTGLAYLFLMCPLNFHEDISSSRWRLAMMGWMPAFALTAAVGLPTDVVTKTIVLHRLRRSRATTSPGGTRHG